VGTKFLLSPKIDAQLSQRTEGRLRDKSTKKNVKTDNAKDKAKKPKVPEVPEEIAEEIEEVEETATRQRPVPYVDLAPKKTATVTEPVKVNQSLPKEDVTYKNRAPVEVGLDIEKIVDSVMEMEVTVPLKSLAGVSGAMSRGVMEADRSGIVALYRGKRGAVRRNCGALLRKTSEEGRKVFRVSTE
jgi:hypothetical protein